ncbi:MAG: flap endonuclease-1 [Candidatus Aenigmarchaeota archaeon]|nr:flap endonuclease-1 [Candidatus Aenigmarchaeota archaeon]
MGVQISDIIEKDPVEMDSLSAKVVAIDAYNTLYQFLSSIRQPDGTPLMDTAGRVTSHLSGLLYRTSRFIEAGMLPVFVFDGKPPAFKNVTLEKRALVKAEAEKKLEEALAKGDMEQARKAAQAASRLTKDMVAEAKNLLNLMGIPVVQAPSEAEAQAAHMTKRGSAFATASQDYDSLLFGSPRLVRNLTITGKKKLPNKETYIEVRPEMVELKRNLGMLGITQEKLIVLGILVGTDFNVGGIKGIGPKKALHIVQTRSVDEIFTEMDFSPYDPQMILNFFTNPPVEDNYEISWKKPDEEGIKKMMVDGHSFSEERVAKVLGTMKKKSPHSQKNLGSWLNQAG